MCSDKIARRVDSRLILEVCPKRASTGSDGHVMAPCPVEVTVVSKKRESGMVIAVYSGPEVCVCSTLHTQDTQRQA